MSRADTSFTAHDDYPLPELSAEDVRLRKAFLEFSEDDEVALQELSARAAEYAEPVIDALYEHFLAFEGARAFFKAPGTLERLKKLQQAYFTRLTGGRYKDEYVENRLKIGMVHERIRLEPHWYLGAYNFYLRAVATRLAEEFSDEPEVAWDHFLRLMKLVFFDIGLAI